MVNIFNININALKKKVHPGYRFNINIKLLQYTGIFLACQEKEIKRAVTFPHLSGYTMEKLLIKSYPSIEIYAFEKETSLYNQIKSSFNIPKNVTLINDNAEEYIKNSKLIFDLIFFDYCGAARQNINGIIRGHLSKGGVFALTEFFLRGALRKENEFIPTEDFETFIPAQKYGKKCDNMQFRVFKKNTPPDLSIKTDALYIAEQKQIISSPVQNAQRESHKEVERKKKERALKQEAARKVVERKERALREVEALKKLGESFLQIGEDLPETERNICQFLIDGVKQAKIAETLNMGQSTVYMYIHKMKERGTEYYTKKAEYRTKRAEYMAQAAEKKKEDLEELELKIEDFLQFKELLPETEREICQLFFIEGVTQIDIAKKYAMTQGAVSSRIKRMKKRIRYIKKTANIEMDIGYLNSFFNAFSIDLINTLIKTTCQSLTGSILNKKYKLVGGAVMSQGKVRTRWNLYKNKISKAMVLPGHGQLRKIYDRMVMTEQNLYILHDLKLPHFHGISAPHTIEIKAMQEAKEQEAKEQEENFFSQEEREMLFNKSSYTPATVAA